MQKFSQIISSPAPPATSQEPRKTSQENCEVLKGRFKIEKTADDKMLAFGWASVAVRTDGEQIEDWQGDMIDPEDLENAAYEFVELYREGGEMHERGGAAVLVESVVFTPEKMAAMGIPAGTVKSRLFNAKRILADEFKATNQKGASL